MRSLYETNPSPKKWHVGGDRSQVCLQSLQKWQEEGKALPCACSTRTRHLHPPFTWHHCDKKAHELLAHDLLGTASPQTLPASTSRTYEEAIKRLP
eukprot:6373735-Amphidinium_carterae.1